MLFLLTLVVAFCASPAFSAIYTTTSLPKDKQYDFIIVGGGTAGNVLANRLSAVSKVKVLLIEAGDTPDAVFNTQVPFLASSLRNSTVDWNFTSTAQPGLNGRSIWYERGHVLGGSSVVNLMAFNRGSNDVWDNWAKLTHDSQWSWKEIKPYYMKTSRLVAPADNHDTKGQVTPSAHGSGPVEVSVPGFPTFLDSLVIDTAKATGGRFSFQQDWNAGNFTGFGYYQASIGNSKRSHSAGAYIDPVDHRDNLDILLNTRATKLINSETRNNKPPVFKTVQFGTSASDLHTLTASKEVILSAGVFGSAQLLLLSGIGPSSELKSLGISPVLNVPDVGKNLVDHPLVPNYFIVNTTGSFDDLLRNTTLLGQAVSQWNTTGQGRLVEPNANTIAFMRLPSNLPALKQYGDPSSGPLSGHTELLFVDGFAPLSSIPHPATGFYITVISSVVSPMSRGAMTLASSDPFAKPLIDPQLLVHNFDTSAMVQAMKDVQTFLKGPMFANLSITAFGDLADAATDDLLLTYARTLSVTINHPVGTAAMSPTGSSKGVVDSNLLLKNAVGVRIVDASVFPQIPECHTQAVVYTLAERAADLIKINWKLKS